MRANGKQQLAGRSGEVGGEAMIVHGRGSVPARCRPARCRRPVKSPRRGAGGEALARGLAHARGVGGSRASDAAYHGAHGCGRDPALAMDHRGVRRGHRRWSVRRATRGADRRRGVRVGPDATASRLYREPGALVVVVTPYGGRCAGRSDRQNAGTPRRRRAPPDIWVADPTLRQFHQRHPDADAVAASSRSPTPPLAYDLQVKLPATPRPALANFSGSFALGENVMHTFTSPSDDRYRFEVQARPGDTLIVPETGPRSVAVLLDTASLNAARVPSVLGARSSETLGPARRPSHPRYHEAMGVAEVRHWRWTIEATDAATAAGLFDGQRVELIERRDLLRVGPDAPAPRCSRTSEINRWLAGVCDVDRFTVGAQVSVSEIPPGQRAPEPDGWVARGPEHRFARSSSGAGGLCSSSRWPTPHGVDLQVKLSRYASAGHGQLLGRFPGRERGAHVRVPSRRSLPLRGPTRPGDRLIVPETDLSIAVDVLLDTHQ